MKYVRTKDGVYKYADYLGIHNGKRYALIDNAKGERATMCQKPEELYKTANTIYRLFDEVVIIHEDGEITQYDVVGDECRHKYDPYYNFDIKHIKLYDGLIKGAIWTDKGLIYVAKLNDRSEWELI